MSIKGYKVFNPDWTCRDFQYEVGKTFKHIVYATLKMLHIFNLYGDSEY